MNGPVRCSGRLLVACLLALIAHSGTANSQAYCSLRDPARAIAELFPNADGYISTVRVIDSDTRSAMAESLPFALHYNELGKHTLYTANASGWPVGFVHVRSEGGSWGLMEFAWAINPDLTIAGLRFQRCRSSLCNDAIRARLLQSIGGQSWQTLKQLMLDVESPLNRRLSALSQAERDFSTAVIRSAMKTALVTELAWGGEIARVVALQVDADAEPSATNSRSVPLSGEAIQEVAREYGGLAVTDPERTRMYRITSGGKPDGWVVQARWQWDGAAGASFWRFSEDGTVQRIVPIPEWTNAELSAAFRGLSGRQFADRSTCESTVEVIAHELYSLARAASADG